MGLKIEVEGTYFDGNGERITITEVRLNSGLVFPFIGVAQGSDIERSYDEYGNWSHDPTSLDLVVEYVGDGIIPPTTLADAQDPTDSVLDEVCEERIRQDDKFGTQDHSALMWVSILGEEQGEVCRAAYEASMAKDPVEAAKWWANYREELVQVAAVAVAMVESFDRNYEGNSND